jgi:hypothetical protein
MYGRRSGGSAGGRRSRSLITAPPPWRGHRAAMMLASHGAGRAGPSPGAEVGGRPAPAPRDYGGGRGEAAGGCQCAAAEGLKNLRMFAIAVSED